MQHTKRQCKDDDCLHLIQQLLAQPLMVVVPAYARTGNHDTVLPIFDGLPQGDPLSCLLFSYCFTVMLKESLLLHPDCKAAAFIDDAVVSAKPELILPLLGTLQDKLGHLQLKINASKTQVWAPATAAAGTSVLAEALELKYQREGFLICGQPYGGDATG